MLKAIKNKLFNKEPKNFVKYKNLILPTVRSNQGLQDNEVYLNSGVEQLDFLIKHNLINSDSEILDFGCGQGRLLNTLIYKNFAFKSYHGIDTQGHTIDWCKKHLTYNSKIKFHHVPAFNERYNNQVDGLLKLPFKDSSFSLVFLNSVFSHMLDSDIAFYINEFDRILQNNGAVYLTAFVEENVPEVEENPDNYLGESKGSLHRVRYEKDFFFKLVESKNMRISQFVHRGIPRTGQSEIVLKK